MAATITKIHSSDNELDKQDSEEDNRAIFMQTDEYYDKDEKLHSNSRRKANLTAPVSLGKARRGTKKEEIVVLTNKKNNAVNSKEVDDEAASALLFHDPSADVLINIE